MRKSICIVYLRILNNVNVVLLRCFEMSEIEQLQMMKEQALNLFQNLDALQNQIMKTKVVK